MSEFKLTIDGREMTAREGQTILQVALANGIDIPHLCYDPRLTPTGACRLCLVEIEGQAGLHTSCTRLAEPGMVVRTETEAVVRSRKSTLEMLLSEHNVSCTTCDADGDCLLQDYAYRYQAAEDRFARLPNASAEPDTYTAGHKGIIYDPSKCVRCQRCVKICAEVEMVEALTLKGRALDVEVSTAFDLPLNDSACETCGLCVSACPTGALWERVAVGQGRAKDLVKVRTTCPYCGVGCQIDLNVNPRTNRIVRVTSEPGCIPNDGNMCVKGRFGLDFVHARDRLTTPLIRENGQLRPAPWDEAIGLVASRFRAMLDEHGPDALAGLSSAKTSNEENYLLQKFVRVVFGSNHVDHCARLCHASTVVGLARAFGSGAMTNSSDEIARAETIFVIGSNTTECHPVIGMTLRQAAARGANLIVADPRKIDLARRATLHMQQACGSDVALINGMMLAILEEGLEDRAFIDERCEGFAEFEEALRQTTVEECAEISGVPADDIRAAARMYAQAETASIVYSMGITQHTTGTDNVLSLANLAMLCGQIGRPSTGVNPLRGQNNVQGACDVGALPDVYPGYQKVDDPAVHDKFSAAWDAELSTTPGLTVVEIINAAAKGDLKGLYIMGENPMISDPDVNHVRQGLEKLDFLVVQDIFLTETAQLADVVLPGQCFAEKDGTFTSTDRRVQRIRRAVAGPGESKPDWEIICLLAEAMGRTWTYGGPSDIADEIASLTPIYGGIHYDRIEKVGLQWPCPDADHPGTPYLHQGKFTRGLGKFHPVVYRAPDEMPDSDYPVVLTTGRLLEHFHTGSMSRRSTVLDWLVPEGVIQVPDALAEQYGIADGDRVRVTSRRGTVEVKASVGDVPRPDTMFFAFHFRECPANMLTNPAFDPIAKIPEFKVCAVKLEKV